MKYKLISLVTALLIIVFALLLTLPQTQSHKRVHQHLAQPAKPACGQTADTFCTHLPIISINTRDQAFTLTNVAAAGQRPHYEGEFITCAITVYDNPTENNSLTDAPAFETQANIKYRGNSSLHFDKKSYKVDLLDADGQSSEDYALLGMPKYDKWILNGPFLDKTLMRNYLCMNIAGEIMSDAPEVRYCELFVNGQYRGVYLAMESVDVSKDRVNITPYSPGAPYTSYLLRQDRDIGQAAKVDVFGDYALKIPSGVTMEIRYPGEKNLTPELEQYIKNDFSAFEKALYSYDYDTMDYGYQNYIDVDSFVDYFIINEFFQNNDAGLFSTNYYKDVRGKIHIGPVWDFNNCSDNYMEAATPISGFVLINRPHYYMLTKDKHFINRVIKRYRQLRKTVLSDQYLLDYIDQTRAFLGDAVDRNYQVWGYSFDAASLNAANRLDPVERNPESYEDAIAQFKTAITTRGAWLDQNIDLLLQYCHSSKVKKFNH